jgi:hypothetical protein
MYNYTLASLSVSFWKLVSYLTYSKLSIQQEFERIKERNSPVGLTLTVILVTMFDSVGSDIYTGRTNNMILHICIAVFFTFMKW